MTYVSSAQESIYYFIDLLWIILSPHYFKYGPPPIVCSNPYRAKCAHPLHFFHPFLSRCPPSLFFPFPPCVSDVVTMMAIITERQWMDGINVWAIISFDWLWVALSAGSIPNAFLGPQEQCVVYLCMCARCHAFCVSQFLCVCLRISMCADMCLFDHIKSLYALQTTKP